MKFEFDSAKSESNRAKHGIDFVAAQKIWNDANRIEREAQSQTEPRFQVIGRLQEKIWSAFITYRETHIRIISVRRARDEERKLYHGR